LLYISRVILSVQNEDDDADDDDDDHPALPAVYL